MLPAHAEDGHELWLRYRQVAAAQAERDRAHASQLIAGRDTATQVAARSELLQGLGGLLGATLPVSETVTQDGAIVVGTPVRPH